VFGERHFKSWVVNAKDRALSPEGAQTIEIRVGHLKGPDANATTARPRVAV
jgi:hypothetical protein